MDAAKNNSRGRGNPRSYPERMKLRLPAGTIARIVAARQGSEVSADVVRLAIERLLRLRLATK